MKFIAGIVAISVFFVIGYFNHPKKWEVGRNTGIATEDAAIFTQYLKGDTTITEIAIMTAMPVGNDYLSDKIPNLKLVKKLFSDLEARLGSDAVANIVYDRKKSDGYRITSQEIKEQWSRGIDQLNEFLSDTVIRRIKKLVIEKGEDLFWIQKYSSREEMVRLILHNQFDSRKTCSFISHSYDSVLVAAVATAAPDAKIVAYHLGTVVSEERRSRIARTLPLDDAYNFFIDSGVPDEKITRLVSSRVSEIKGGYSLLFYFAAKRLTESEVLRSMKNKSTDQLIGYFPNRIDIPIWSFPYETFANQVIKSVKRKNDYKRAIEFFKQTVPKDAARWIEVLGKKQLSKRSQCGIRSLIRNGQAFYVTLPGIEPGFKA